MLKENGVHLSTYYINYDYDKDITELNLVVLVHAYTNLLPLMSKIASINQTKTLTLSSQIDI